MFIPLKIHPAFGRRRRGEEAGKEGRPACNAVALPARSTSCNDVGGRAGRPRKGEGEGGEEWVTGRIGEGEKGSRNWEGELNIEHPVQGRCPLRDSRRTLNIEGGRGRRSLPARRSVGQAGVGAGKGRRGGAG